MNRTTVGFVLCFSVSCAALYFSLLRDPPPPPDPRLDRLAGKGHIHDVYVDISVLAAFRSKIDALAHKIEQHAGLFENHRSELDFLAEQLNEVHTLALRGDGGIGLSTIFDELAEDVRDNGHLTRQNVLAISRNAEEISRVMHYAGHAHNLGHRALDEKRN